MTNTEGAPLAARLLGLAWVTLSLLCTAYPGGAGAEASLDARRKVVAEEQAANVRLQADLKVQREERQAKLDAQDPAQITPAMLEQARLDVEAARVQLESTQVDQQSALQGVEELETAIRNLDERIKSLKNVVVEAAEAQSREPQIEQLQQSLGEKKALLEVEKQHLANEQAAQQAARDALASVQTWAKALQDLYTSREEQNRQEALEDLQLRLQKVQQTWLARAAEWRKDLSEARGQGAEAEAQRHLLEARIRDGEERANLAQSEIKLAQAKSKLASLEGPDLSAEAPAETLAAALEQVQGLLDELGSSQSLLQRRITLLEQHQKVVAKRETLTASAREHNAEETQIIAALVRSMQAQKADLEQVIRAAQARQEAIKSAHEDSVRRGLFVRRGLPKDVESWAALSQELLWFPWTVLQTLAKEGAAVLLAFARFDPARWALLIAVQSVWLGFIVWLRGFLDRAIGAALAQSLSFSRSVALVSTEVLRNSLLAITSTGASLLAIWASDQHLGNLLPIIVLLIIWLAVDVLTNLAWQLLVAPRVPAEERKPKVYGELRWMHVVGGLFTAVTVLGHVMTLSLPARDFISRTYMLFLLLITLPALRIRTLMLERLGKHLGRPYWVRVVHLLSLLFPLSIATGAMVGLLGYVNLAWAVGTFLGWFLLVLAGWLISRGLVRDLATLLTDYVHLHSRYGSLWADGVIEPLHKLARVALFILAWLVLFRLYGWGQDSPVVAGLLMMLNTPLFAVGGVSITLASILVTVLIVVVVVWLGRWSREVTYRWVFARVLDPGVRNSLSVFAQYAVVLVGLLITLRTLGLDLTTFAIFAGALGVGIGFGLQNLTNNFISGIMLLIERPLRTGDIVNIGNREGTVTRIGIRSLTVRNWDNQEVIIPNAEITSSAFTNWTRSDRILRTKLTLGVSYDDDPHRVQQLIEQVLKNHPSVLKVPPPAVWLSEFGSSSVNFHLQYFFDLSRHSLPELRSQILFAIWDKLKGAGIRIPYPQQDVYIKESPVSDALVTGAGKTALG